MELTNGCPLLGVTEFLPVINVEIFNYTSEFTLLCYTDGLTDTINSEKETISVESIEDLIRKNNKSTPDFLNKTILFYAEEFKGDVEFPDDIALLTLKVSDLNF
jgi:serine phosphatase RsbU (regulator of sigma subunit)